MEEYGEANLGTKGMALFFSSHLCSPLCFALGLTQFDLSDEVNIHIYIYREREREREGIILCF